MYHSMNHSERGTKHVLSKNRLRKVIALVALVCISSIVLENAILSSFTRTKNRRHLLCNVEQKRNTKEDFSSRGASKGHAVQRADKRNHMGRSLTAFEQLVERILEGELLGDDCDTTYPPGAQDSVVHSSDSPIALEEPPFDIAAEESEFRNDDEASFILAPNSPEDNILDETERALVSVYDPQEYDPEAAVLRASDRDADTIAYTVFVTGCPELYQPSGQDIEEEPGSGSDLYEASAILKAQVCEMTDEAVISRRLRRTRKLRQLEDSNQLSAVEMNYTM